MGLSAPASHQFSQLQRDLHKMSKAQRKKLRRDFTRIGQMALSDARSRAGAWSSRIPRAIESRPIMDVARGRVGVELRVRLSRDAPHARAFEGITQQGSNAYFRHPVFGDTDRWRSQPTRPYLWPAVRGRAVEANRAAQAAVESAAREAGFR